MLEYIVITFLVIVYAWIGYCLFYGVRYVWRVVKRFKNPEKHPYLKN